MKNQTAPIDLCDLAAMCSVEGRKKDIRPTTGIQPRYGKKS